MHYTQDPASPPADAIGFDDFMKVDIRVGTIQTAEAFPEARKPAYKLAIDFGPGVGVKKARRRSPRTTLEELPGRRVMAVVNFRRARSARCARKCWCWASPTRPATSCWPRRTRTCRTARV